MYKMSLQTFRNLFAKQRFYLEIVMSLHKYSFTYIGIFIYIFISYIAKLYFVMILIFIFIRFKLVKVLCNDVMQVIDNSINVRVFMVLYGDIFKWQFYMIFIPEAFCEDRVLKVVYDLSDNFVPLYTHNTDVTEWYLGVILLK